MAGAVGLSALCRKRTQPPSLNHVVGAAKERGREGDAEGFGCLEVDKQLDFRDLLDRQISRLGALDYASGIDASLTVRLRKTASVAHQAAGDREVPRLVDRRHRVADSQGGKLFTVRAEQGIGGDHESGRPQLGQGCKRGIEVSFSPGVQEFGAVTRGREPTSAGSSIVNRP